MDNSPYLNLPLRTLAQARADILRHKLRLEAAQARARKARVNKRPFLSAIV